MSETPASSAENDTATRQLPWLCNLTLDFIEWATLTSGIGFREFRSLGREARREGDNYCRETRVTPPAEPAPERACPSCRNRWADSMIDCPTCGTVGRIIPPEEGTTI